MDIVARATGYSGLREPPSLVFKLEPQGYLGPNRQGADDCYTTYNV